MQLHDIKPKTKRKKSQQIGRGGKRGKTAGRGTKGQKARAGHKIRPELRDYIKKLPKLRGRGKNSNLSIQTKPVVVKLSSINGAFTGGEKVTPFTLVAKKVISIIKGRYPKVKILSNGEIEVKVTIEGCEVSAGAKALIEKAGGTVK